MSNCVIYVRVSTEDQALGKSLEAQQQDCEQFAATQGLVVLRVFCEPGESAKSADRPVFQEMIRYCRERKSRVSKIVFWKVSRFMRNIQEGYYFIHELQKVGCRIASATEPLPDGMAGDILLNNYLLISQLDNSMRADSTRRAMQQLSTSGYWVHQAPYGYKPARDANGFPILSEDPEYGPAVRHVFLSIAAGQMDSVGALRYLREHGVRGVRSARAFSTRSLHDLLRKEVYCGRVRNSYTGGRSVEARFPGLISSAVFDQVQSRLSGRSVSVIRQRVHEDFPLRGMVDCEVCCKPLTASWSRGRSCRYAYYFCPACGSRVSKRDLETVFVELLNGITLRTSRRLSAFREILLEEWTALHGSAREQRTSARARIEKLQRQSAKLLDVLLNGTISEIDYAKRDRSLKAEIAMANAELNSDPHSDIDLASVLQFADRLLANLSSTWLSSSGQIRQWFQQGVFPDRLQWSAKSGLRTVTNNHLFSALEPDAHLSGGLAPPTTAHWNRDRAVEFVARIQELQQRIAA